MNRFGVLAATAWGGLMANCIVAPSMALESPQQVAATSLLGSLASGPNYSVTAPVRSDGLMDIFIFDTSYGQYQVDGLDLAKTFSQELRALDAINKIEKSDLFAKSFGKTVTAPIRYGADLVFDPFNTIGRSVSGVANMFDRVGAGLTNPKAARESATDSLFGVDDARRGLAIQLGVDPYTRFPPLAEKLTELAGAAAAGGITVKVALAAIPGGAGMVVSLTGGADAVRNTLRDKTSAQIAQEVRSILRGLQVPGYSIDRFVENRAYSPADLLVTAKALQRLNAANTKDFIDRAASITARDVAFFQRRRAEFLADHSRDLGGITSFVMVGGIPLNRTSNGNVVAAFPFDTFAWTPLTEGVAKTITGELRRMRSVAPKPVLATANAATPAATSEMQKLGWQVVQLR